MKMIKMDSSKEVPEVSCGGWVTVMPFRQNGRLEDSFYVREVAQFMEVLFLNLTSMTPCAILIFPITDAHGTVFRPAGAGSAVESRVAVFIKDAVVVGLLEGVEVTLIISVAFRDAVLEVYVVESIHIVSLAFVTGVAVPCWTPVNNGRMLF